MHLAKPVRNEDKVYHDLAQIIFGKGHLSRYEWSE